MRGVPRLQRAIVFAARGVDRDLEARGAAVDDLFQLLIRIIIEMVRDAEPVAKRRGEHAGARRRPDQREARCSGCECVFAYIPESKTTSIRKVFHRGIEILFDRSRRAGGSRR